MRIEVMLTRAENQFSERSFVSMVYHLFDFAKQDKLPFTDQIWHMPTSEQRPSVIHPFHWYVTEQVSTVEWNRLYKYISMGLRM